MVYRQKKTVHIFIGFAIVLAALLMVSNFIKSPLRISSYSVVLPKEKWLLTIGGGGQIISNVIDYTKGHTTQYNITQFERGEFVAVNFSKVVMGKSEFSQGDTIVSMLSSNFREQLVTAEGELQVALANLNSQSSAEKEPLIKEAETRLSYTEEKIGEQKTLFERTKQLFDKGFIAQQEFELQKWTLDLLLIEKKIYAAQVENLKTGVKPAELNLLESQINSVKARLNFLKERESQMVILSPINGKIAHTLSPDTLLNVINSQQIILHMPVKLIDLSEFEVAKQIPITFPTSNVELTGTIVSIDREVKLMNQHQVVMVSVLMENSAARLLPGMVTELSMRLREITYFEQLVRIITH